MKSDLVPGMIEEAFNLPGGFLGRYRSPEDDITPLLDVLNG
jgi:hypothetical protein